MSDPVVIPVFVELMHRHDLQRIDALVYGALCVLHRPRIADIARAVGLRANRRSRSVTDAITRLRNAQLVVVTSHSRTNEPWEYAPVGPRATLAPCVTTYVHRAAS